MPTWRFGAALLLTLLSGARVGVAKPLHHSAPSNLDMSARHLSYLIANKEMYYSGRLADCLRNCGRAASSWPLSGIHAGAVQLLGCAPGARPGCWRTAPAPALTVRLQLLLQPGALPAARF
jgi:hypothetical protein